MWRALLDAAPLPTRKCSRLCLLLGFLLLSSTTSIFSCSLYSSKAHYLLEETDSLSNNLKTATHKQRLRQLPVAHSQTKATWPALPCMGSAGHWASVPGSWYLTFVNKTNHQDRIRQQVETFLLQIPRVWHSRPPRTSGVVEAGVSSLFAPQYTGHRRTFLKTGLSWDLQFNLAASTIH